MTLHCFFAGHSFGQTAGTTKDLLTLYCLRCGDVKRINFITPTESSSGEGPKTVSAEEEMLKKEGL